MMENERRAGAEQPCSLTAVTRAHGKMAGIWQAWDKGDAPLVSLRCL